MPTTQNDKKIIIDPKYKWEVLYFEDVTVYYKGRTETVNEISKIFVSNDDLNIDPLQQDKLKLLFSKSVGHFALIIETPKYIIAAVDKIRSIPLFYVEKDGDFFISNSGRRLKSELNLEKYNTLSLLEFKMAFYVTDRDTLFNSLFQLQSGEFLIWNKCDKKLHRDRYYIFYSDIKEENEDELIEKHEEITNRVFKRTIEDAKGRPIFIPLSAGLDSRFILTKLKHMGYDNLQTFSYGPPGNHDAKWAKVIADKVGVKWFFVPYIKKHIRDFFWSKTRESYWDYSGEFCSLPFMVDEYALHYIKNKKLAQDNTVFMTGYSGDFTSGGHVLGHHIPLLEPDKQYPKNLIIEAIIKKHYSNNKPLIANEENRNKLSYKIESTIGLKNNRQYTRDKVIKLYELWEWQERQSKYVVNGMRSYDFFGFDWFLPLWADEYLFFWSQINYKLKLKQKLYRNYLGKMNLFNLFRDFNPVVWNWQRGSMIVPPIAKIAKVLFGKEKSQLIYHYCAYWGRYSNHIAPFGYSYFKKARHIKSSLALYAEEWLNREKINVDNNS